jgi:hypothetical protein
LVGKEKEKSVVVVFVVAVDAVDDA